jgi:hypothetical protein
MRDNLAKADAVDPALPHERTRAVHHASSRWPPIAVVSHPHCLPVDDINHFIPNR